MLLYRKVSPPRNEYPGYDTKQSDGAGPVMLELCGMQSKSSLRSLTGPIFLSALVHDRSNRTVFLC